MQVDPIKPTVKAPGTRRLKPELDNLLSSFAFNFNLCRYNKSVLKNLLTSSLAAFDLLPVHRLQPAELGVLLDVLAELTAGAYTRSLFGST